MTDSSDRSSRSKSRRKGSRKKAAALNAYLFPLVMTGLGLIVLVGIAVTLGPSVRKILSQPSAATILAAQAPFEREHLAERGQSRVLPVWRPLNHESRSFNVLIPIPCKLELTSHSSGDNVIKHECFRALVDYNDINSPLIEVSVGSYKFEGKTASDFIQTLDDRELTRLMSCDRVVTNRITTWNGLECREVELLRQGRRDLAKFVVLGPTEYVILSFVFVGDPPQELIDRFFNSFSLEGDPAKYGSPPGWPETSAAVVARCGTMRTVQMFPREMDRSRWLKLEDQPVDVLAHVDVFRDANSGNWYRYEKGVVSPKAKTPMLVLPVEPVDSYEMLLEVRRLSWTPESFNIGLIVGGKPAMVVIDGFGGATTCLSPTDGMYARNVAQIHTGRLLGSVSNTILVRVTPDSVQVDVDGRKNVINFSGDPSRLGLADFWQPPENALFLADWETQYYITKCEMRKL